MSWSLRNFLSVQSIFSLVNDERQTIAFTSYREVCKVLEEILLSILLILSYCKACMKYTWPRIEAMYSSVILSPVMKQG